MTDTISWRLVTSPDINKQSLTIFYKDKVYTVNNSHIYFKDIIHKVEDNDPDFLYLLNLEETLNNSFLKITNNVTITDGKVFYKGKAIDNSLTREILTLVSERSKSLRGMVNFMESLMCSASDIARESLFDWVQTIREVDCSAIQINDDGSFMAYKVCNYNKDAGLIFSKNSGPGIINGVEVNGHLDNSIGNIIELPRFKVLEDRDQACGIGLHCGTYHYAYDIFGNPGNAIIKVKVYPQDVISVPKDHSAEKIRTCKYEVVEFIEEI